MLGCQNALRDRAPGSTGTRTWHRPRPSTGTSRTAGGTRVRATAIAGSTTMAEATADIHGRLMDLPMGIAATRPGLVSGGDSVRARVGGTRAAVFASIQQRSSVLPWPLLKPSRSALVKK